MVFSEENDSSFKKQGTKNVTLSEAYTNFGPHLLFVGLALKAV